MHVPLRARSTRAAALFVVTLALVPVAGSTGAAAQVEDAVGYPADCTAPAPDAEPGTPEWDERDLHNISCAERRLVDAAQHPLIATPITMPVSDPYRDPALHDGVRVRHHTTTVTGREGEEIPVELYAPCTPATCDAMAEDLPVFQGPFPAVVIQHGGYEARKELHRWATQSLAEAGYITIAADGDHDRDEYFEQVTDVLDWFLATPEDPASQGDPNPFAGELDRSRIGMAGHSGGGATANRIGNEDPRVSAVVAWDRSGRYDLPEEIVVPSLYLVAEYGFTPERTEEPPNPDGYDTGGEWDPGDRWQDFDRARADGVDTMKLVLRASTHLDWVPIVSASGQYGEAVSAYYTRAWFDRYLKGTTDGAIAEDAFARLTATEFDDSYDRHNISQGYYDPAQQVTSADPYGGNVPYLLEGMPVADRLSFYYLSKCSLTDPATGTLVGSEDLRSEACVAGEPVADEPSAPAAEPEATSLPATGGGHVALALAAGAAAALLRRRSGTVAPQGGHEDRGGGEPDGETLR